MLLPNGTQWHICKLFISVEIDNLLVNKLYTQILYNYIWLKFVINLNLCSWVLGTRFLVSCCQMYFPPSSVFQDRVAFDPGVIHRSLVMSLLLSGWLKEILNSTVQQQLWALLIIAGACRCFAESWVGMHPELLRGKKEEENERFCHALGQ